MSYTPDGEGLDSLGIKNQVFAGCDIDKKALKIYAANHAPKVILPKDLNTYIEFSIQKTSESNIRFNNVRFAGKDLSAIEALMGGCDILVADPPCQGHSNLNNHSRRDDPRNNLYISVAAYASLLKPKHIAIENMQTVIHDNLVLQVDQNHYCRALVISSAKLRSMAQMLGLRKPVNGISYLPKIRASTYCL